LPEHPGNRHRDDRIARRRAACWLLIPAVLALAVLVSGTARAGEAEDFTIVVLPDTQIYAQNHPHIFRAQAEWIVANAQALNIKMVLHEGDVVNQGGNLQQWQNAVAALSIIDQAGIPMFIAIGNHDYNPVQSRTTTNFNRFLGIDRYRDKPWFSGAFAPEKSENVYGVVEAGGRKYLVLVLEFAPRRAVVAWANEVVAANPDHDVIVVTHDYLFSDGSHHVRLNESGGDYGLGGDSHTGAELWEALVRRHPNIVLVLSGHVGGDGTGRRIDFGDHGNLVHQIVTNYQFRAMGGGGYLRIMRYRPSAGVIEVSTYSPHLDAWMTDPANQFTLAYNPGDREWERVSIEGTAVDARTGQALSGGLVSLRQGAESLNANPVGAGGRFRFDVPPGEYKLVVIGPGEYLPGEVYVHATEPGGVYAVEVPLRRFDSAISDEQPVYAGLGGRLRGNLAEGAPTDIVMMNSKLSLKISAEFNDPQLDGVTVGKVIDMAAAGQIDGIDWINTYLSKEQPVWNNSGALATVRYDSVEVVRVTPEEAVVEARGVYLEEPGVTVRTTYTLRPDHEWVEVVTTVFNPGDADLVVWIGDTMDNDDGTQRAYVPGHGVITGGARRARAPSEPWIAHYGNSPQVYAFVFDKDATEFINFGSNNTIMSQGRITIPAGGEYSFRRYFAVVGTAGRDRIEALREVVERIH